MYDVPVKNSWLLSQQLQLIKLHCCPITSSSVPGLSCTG